MSSSKTGPDVKPNQGPFCCQLTGAERSAVAVIALRGAGADSLVARCFAPATPRPLSSGEVRYGRWHGGCLRGPESSDRPPASELASESVVVTPLDHDSFELHCHGGPAAVDRIMTDLQAHGAIRREPPQWFDDSPDTPLILREAEQVLRHCLTARTAGRAMDQLRGSLRDWAQNQINELRADCSDDALDRLHGACRERLREATWACRLSEPFRVVLCGPPNVGKSSLANAIVGYERSITFDQAGTTRDVLHAETVIEGLPVQLTDTAGLRLSEEVIEREGVSRARRAADSADLVIWVSQPGLPNSEADMAPNGADTDRLRGLKQLRVLNKADLLSERNPPEALPSDTVATVATTGRGVEELIQQIAASLVDPADRPGRPMVLTERQRECVRDMLAAASTDSAIDALNRLIHG